MIQVLLWLPVAVGLVCFVVPRRAVAASAILGSGIVLGLAIALVAGFHTTEAGSSTRSPRAGSRTSASATSSGWTGSASSWCC